MGRQLPLLERVQLALLEAAALLGAADREPELEQVHAAAHELALELGAWRRNSSYSASVQKPITRSTPARLYQLRSNSTISPRVGRCWM
jgi:hypothetical protein